MDLSKVYDCIPLELLIAKLKFYDIENVSPRLLLYYLTNSKQKTKNGSSFILWRDILTQVYSKDQSLVLFFLIFS